MKPKRKVQDEPIELTDNFLPTLLKTIQTNPYPYKTNTIFLHQRDTAVMAFIILTGTRVSETRLIRKKQLTNYKDNITVRNIETLKRGKTRDKVIMPKKGGLAPFTKIIENWLNQIPTEDAVLFPTTERNGQLNWNKPLSRIRILQIVNHNTNKFPHWLRGVHETLYGIQIFQNDPYALTDHMGLRRLDSVLPYVTSQKDKYTKNIYTIT